MLHRSVSWQPAAACCASLPLFSSSTPWWEACLQAVLCVVFLDSCFSRLLCRLPGVTVSLSGLPRCCVWPLHQVAVQQHAECSGWGCLQSWSQHEQLVAHPLRAIMGADHGGAGLQVDMSNEEQVAAMVAEAKRSLPQLSIFVNNAAVFVLKSVTEASEAGGHTCQLFCKAVAVGSGQGTKHHLA